MVEHVEFPIFRHSHIHHLHLNEVIVDHANLMLEKATHKMAA